MRLFSRTTIGVLLFSAGFGCAHNGYYTFANTRKFMESNALAITKVVFSAPLTAVEAVSTPATIYMDAPKYSSEREHVYLSYLGMQTLTDSDMHGLYKFMAALMILPIDTAWFPVAGTVDTIYAINRPPPAEPDVETPEPAVAEDDTSMSELPSRSESTSPAEVEWPEWVFEGTDLYVDEAPPYAEIAPLPLFYVRPLAVRQKQKWASWPLLTEFAWNS